MVKKKKPIPLLTITEDVDYDADTLGETVNAKEDNALSDDGDLTELAPGAKAGRYMILDQLGRGGMGVVYKAYDPELDRQIALKLLSTKKKSRTSADQAKERLLREAQALARLSHPNVVSAYDVGTIGGEVFVAMELLDGKTLKEWIDEDKPNQKNVVEVLVAAGKGIAAAHKAGLIHRDIKAENIIVGTDGRVRVLDFGLARVASNKEIEKAGQDLQDWTGDFLVSGHSTDSDIGKSNLDKPMTMDGVVMGTPGYMAPEQYTGGDLDELSDQYSFCVTLYEALYGQKPHRARTFKQMKEKVTTKAPGPPPQDIKIPLKWKKIIFKGLSLSRLDRFASMNELLAELAIDPHLATKRWAGGSLALLLLLGTFIGATQWQSMRDKKCQGAEQKLIGVWDRQLKQTIKGAFGKSGRQYAAATFERVENLLDQRASEWLQERAQACEATRVKGEQSEQLMDLRMMCLDRRLGEIKALTAVFAHQADAQVVDKAVQAVADLPTLEPCRDVKALASGVLLPTDPNTRKQIKAIREQLAMAGALEKSGKYAEGFKVAEECLLAAKKIAYLPLEAEVMYQLGLLQEQLSKYDEAEASLRQAAWLADYSGLDEVREKAMLRLVFVLGYLEYKLDEAKKTGKLAKAIIGRLGNDERTLAEWNEWIGLSYNIAGEYDLALKHLHEAFRMMKKVLGPEHLRVAGVLISLGFASDDKGDLDQAAKYTAQAIQIREKALGPKHPEVAKAYNNIGIIYYEKGDYDRAMAYYNSALEIRETILGADHSEVGVSLINIGLLFYEKGDYQPAMKNYLRALDNWEKSLGKNHPHLTHILNGMGNVFLRQDKFEQARTHFNRALEILNLAKISDNPQASYSQNGLGWIELHLGNKARAATLFEKVIHLCGTDKCTGEEIQPLAETQFGLAQILWPNPKKRGRALNLAEKCRLIFKDLHSVQAKTNLDLVRSWLASRDSKTGR